MLFNTSCAFLSDQNVQRPPKKRQKSLLHWFKPFCLVFCVFQLIASNLEGRSSPSEVLVCNTSPDKPGPPSRPCIKGSIRPYSFSVKWGMVICAAKMFSWSCCICWIGFWLWGKLEISFMFGGKCNRFCVLSWSFELKWAWALILENNKKKYQQISNINIKNKAVQFLYTSTYNVKSFRTGIASSLSNEWVTLHLILMFVFVMRCLGSATFQFSSLFAKESRTAARSAVVLCSLLDKYHFISPP